MLKQPPSQAYRLIEPGPIVLVTTRHKGKSNVMTMGFHMMIQHEPPLIGCIIGPWDFTYAALCATRECVIGIPSCDLAEKVVDIGNCSGAELDKFGRFGLTPKPASCVRAPLIAECFANLECRVSDDGLVARYNMVILAVEALWIDDTRGETRTLHHRGDGSFTVDGEVLDLRSRMVRWRDLPH